MSEYKIGDVVLPLVAPNHSVFGWVDSIGEDTVGVLMLSGDIEYFSPDEVTIFNSDKE